MMGRAGVLFVAALGLVGCGGSDWRTGSGTEGDSVQRTNTIEKGDFSLAYTCPVDALSYGENGLISLELIYPVDYVPELSLGNRGTEATMDNGVILGIDRDDPVILGDGSAAMALRIGFEAFLPGVVTLGQFAVDFGRPEDAQESRVSIEVDALEFTFYGDPSLTDLQEAKSPPPELAGLIVVPEKRARVWVLPIVIALLVLSGGALLAFFPRKKPAIRPPDPEQMLNKLRVQFEGEFLGDSRPDDLRPAYEALNRAVQWVPRLGGRPEMRAKLITECAKVRFSGQQVTGEKAMERLRGLYRLVVEDGEA
jgi:hypothetical protein